MIVVLQTHSGSLQFGATWERIHFYPVFAEGKPMLFPALWCGTTDLGAVGALCEIRLLLDRISEENERATELLVQHPVEMCHMPVNLLYSFQRFHLSQALFKFPDWFGTF